MSSGLMFLIAAIYICASGFYFYESKYAWSLISACWGIGNAMLGWMSRG